MSEIALSAPRGTLENDKVCMIDMDDTLYDYLGQIRRDLAALQSPQEDSLPDDLWTNSPPWLHRRISLLKNQPGWWLSLPRFQLGWEIYSVAREIGYSIEILTRGPATNSRAWAEKMECVRRDFGREVSLNIVGATKRRTYARVLVDDYPPYALDWLAHRPRGLVIMPAHSYNLHVRHLNVIRYDGTNLDQVRKAMTLAFHRQAGEPLRID